LRIELSQRASSDQTSANYAQTQKEGHRDSRRVRADQADSKPLSTGGVKKKWSKAIEEEYKWEMGVIEDLRKKIKAKVDEVIAMYTQVAANARQKLIQRLDLICPKPPIQANLDSMRQEMLNLLDDMQSKRFKEDSTTVVVAQEFIDRFKIPDKVLSYHMALTQSKQSDDLANKTKLDFKKASFDQLLLASILNI